MLGSPCADRSPCNPCNAVSLLNTPPCLASKQAGIVSIIAKTSSLHWSLFLGTALFHSLTLALFMNTEMQYESRNICFVEGKVTPNLVRLAADCSNHSVRTRRRWPGWRLRGGCYRRRTPPLTERPQAWWKDPP